MSKRPFITQDCSPNILIVPTLSFCGPPPKTTKTDSEKVQTAPCVQSLSLSKSSESSLGSMTENSVTNTSAESLEGKSGDSSSSLSIQSVKATARPRQSSTENSVTNTSAESSDSKRGESYQSRQSVNATPRPRPSSSWASNYLMSIGDSNSPIKLNLSPFRKKKEAPKGNMSQNKSAQHEGLPPAEIKTGTPIEEPRGPSKITNGSSICRSKDNLTKNINAANLSSLPKTDFTRDDTNITRMKRPSEYETQTSSKRSKISSEINQRLYKATDSHTRYGDKIKAPITSKYIPTPDKYKYNKYNQSSSGRQKTSKDGVKKPSYLCKSSCCTAKDIRDKIKTSQNKIVEKPKQNLKEVPVKKNTTEMHIKSTVTKKPSPVKHKEPYYSTDYLKSYKNYDIQTIKYKEFYNKYKIPKISDRNKKFGETRSAEVTENDTNKNRISAKDIFAKELCEADCSTPIKSVVKVADDPDRKVNKSFDLRSKLSCRSLNHHFTMLRNLSGPERTHTVPIDRESLLITLPNDTDYVEVEPSTKTKLDDGKITKKKETIKTPTKKERVSPKIKEVNKSPKTKEVKNPSSKFKKIKLVINVICEKSGTSSSDSEDEESVENSDTEKKDNISSLDLSFLDDFNIDEIVESLGGVEKCERTSDKFKENTADDFNVKSESDHINDIDVTDKNMYSAAVTDSENERSLLMEKDIKTEEWTNKSEVYQSSNNIESEKAIKTSLNDFAQEQKVNPIDEVLRMSSCKLPMTDIHNLANDTETKQQKNSKSCDVLSVKENLNNETNSTLVISNKFDTLKTDNGVAISNEIKHRNEVPVVLETDKLGVGINNTRDAITDINSLQETNNNMAITKSDNVCSYDVSSENISEPISAILKFLQTNKTRSSEVSESSSATKDILLSNKMPERNNTNSFETVHNSISIARESSETYNVIGKPDVMEKINEVMVIDKTEDTKKEENHETQANSNNACNESSKSSKQQNYDTDTMTNINGSDDNGAVQEKLAQKVLETKQLRKNKINEPIEVTNKVRTEDDGKIEKQINHIGKKDQENDIQENVDTNQEILHKTDKQEIEKNSTMDESNTDVKLKLEAIHQSSPHQGDTSFKTQSLDEKTKDHYTDSQNKKENEVPSITNDDISEITIDLTYESDENPETVKEDDVANGRESVTKTSKRNFKAAKENCFKNDDVLEISTNIETKYIDFTLIPNTYLSDITIDLTQESNGNPDTANLKENFSAKDPDAIKEKCGINNESVPNKTKNSAMEVKENYVNVTNNDALVIKEKCGNNNESVPNKTKNSAMEVKENYVNVTNNDALVIKEKCGNNNESVPNKTKNSAMEVKENYVNVTNNDALVIKEKCGNNNESVPNKTKDSAMEVKENCVNVTNNDALVIKEKCCNNNESVPNTTKDSAMEVKENDVNVTNNEALITKTTRESAETCEENCAAPEESGPKTNAHKDQSQSENTTQSSVVNKPDKVSEDKTKEKPEVTEDFLQMEASLAKKITDAMQHWSKKKHTIKSLIHYGQFSKIYECVNECGDKYAVKIMHGNIVKYRYSKTESIMKRLQRDVPHENYHCVYLYQGFGSTTNWCLLMELYPKNLKQALQENEKSFHINLIQDLSRQLVSAVTLLRNKNIVHTNIKPTHILMNSTNDQLKLCGFDEAQYVGGIQFCRDVGAMNYRAPEIILGHSAGFQMDVWSTALVMYEMATNIQLFPGIVHNDILYKQMFVCGPVPYEMLMASKFKNEHFSGYNFLRQTKGGNCSKIPCRIMCKHDLVKKYVYLTYKQDWHGVTSYKQKQKDYAKLQHFCQLIHKMLTMDPKQRLPIEFVFADPFIYETTTGNILLKPSADKIKS